MTNSANLTQGMPLNCPNCGYQFSAIVESIIDAGRDPGAKARFMSGRSNTAQCPNCGVMIQMSVPLVYHDHTKELLLIYFPQQLNLPTQERERMLGEMTRAVMNSLPQNERKGYLFNPITPLTQEGMLEIILDKDGITPEMIKAQQEKVLIIQKLLETPPDKLAEVVQQYDADIDAEFVQMMTLSAEAALNSGNRQAAQMVIQHRDAILELSSYGQAALAEAQEQEAVIEEVAAKLQSMGRKFDFDNMIDYLLTVADSQSHLQAVVGLARPIFDEKFFSTFARKLRREKDPVKAQKLSQIQEELLSFIEVVDQQQQAYVQQAVAVLQDILSAPDMDQAISERIMYIDDLFMSVLAANLQQAEGRGDFINVARLKSLHEKIMQAVQASAPPELQFINELLNQPDAIEMRLMLSERAADYGENLLLYLDSVIESVQTQGADELVEQLIELRRAAQQIIQA